METIPTGLRLVSTAQQSVTEMAIWGEELGFDSVWLSEGWGRDAFVTLTNIANQTNTITLGTSIVNVYSRTPAVLTMASKSLIDVAGDRFILGLGVSHQVTIENLHGLPYDQPLQQLRETIGAIRSLTNDSDQASFSGDIIEIKGFPPLDVDIPIYNAALGDVNRRLTGRICDGWLPYNIPLTEIDTAYESVRSGANDANRDESEITIAPWVTCAVSEDPENARNAVQRHLARYIGRFAAYRDAASTYFPAAIDVADHWQSGDQETAAALVSDDMVDAMSITGTPTEVRDEFDEFCEHSFIDHPIITSPHGADDAMVTHTLETLAPANR